MTTSQDNRSHRADRRPAQVAALLGVLCAVVAFFWDSGLCSFPLVIGGLLATIVGVALTPDGWLVDPEDAE